MRPMLLEVTEGIKKAIYLEKRLYQKSSSFGDVSTVVDSAL